MTKSKQRSILKKIKQAIKLRHADLLATDIEINTLETSRELSLEVLQRPETGEMQFYITTDGKIHIANTCEHPIDGAEGIHVALTTAQLVILGKVADLASLIIETSSH